MRGDVICPTAIWESGRLKSSCLSLDNALHGSLLERVWAGRSQKFYYGAIFELQAPISSLELHNT